MREIGMVLDVGRYGNPYVSSELFDQVKIKFIGKVSLDWNGTPR